MTSTMKQHKLKRTMTSRGKVCGTLLLMLLVSGGEMEVNCKCLVREPASATSPQSIGDAGFYLAINSNPEFYQEQNLYTITLKGEKTQFVTKQFTEFLLVVESGELDENASSGSSSSPSESQASSSSSSSSSVISVGHSSLARGRTGSFQLLGDVLTRFSDHCTNTVTQTSEVAKSEIQVLWRAPPAGSGCVVFKATVVESPEKWVMDNGRLTLRLCEATVEEHSVNADDVSEPCCACEEAKYEVSFEGLWSEASHPKNFPTNAGYLLHFSDIIGASHSADYRVWEYGGYASKGLEQVAKWGSPLVLESELKAESNHIRTIIKARGLHYPNLNGKAFAMFRTDQRNHLMSLVSMIGPSPDWIVGVSGLELCLANCSWIDKKELFLYPWDAGVDDGISYQSADSPSDPFMPITRITSRHPDDPRQPFWNETGAPIKPLAKLTVKRQRIYAKACGDGTHFESSDHEFDFDQEDAAAAAAAGFGGGFGANPELDDDFVDDEMLEELEELEEEEDEAVECRTQSWSEWTSCSATCGKGVTMRKRKFLMPEKAQMMGCAENKRTVQKKICGMHTNPPCQGFGGSVATDGSRVDNFVDMCATSEWSKWSECSTSCGKGFISRTRRFFNRMGRKKCLHVETMEKKMCAGVVSECPSHQGVERAKNPHCAVTSWSEWSPCSVSCGKGLKVRTRLYMVSPQQRTSAECNVQLMEKGNCEGPRPECQFNQQDATFICNQEKEMGPCRGYFPRWHFSAKTKMCLQFIYGGCRGNSNNFDRYEDCMKLCEIPHVYSQHNNLHSSHDSLAAVSSDLEQQAARGQSDNDLDEDEDDEDEVDLDMAEIRRKMMELQEQQHRLSGGSFNAGAGGGPRQPRLQSAGSNVFETRSERRQRLLEAERSRQMMKMKEQMMYTGPTTIHPPVDCLVTAWSPWSECSATCQTAGGSGHPVFREKFRMIKRHDAAGGKKCPRKLRRRQKCRLPACHDDCVLGEWGGWSECSQSCGSDGLQERARRVEHQPSHGGRPCGLKVEKRMCNLVACPSSDPNNGGSSNN